MYVGGRTNQAEKANVRDMKVRVGYCWMWHRRMVGGMQLEDILLDTNIGLSFFFIYLVALLPMHNQQYHSSGSLVPA